MKLGVYTAVLHDKPLHEALQVIRDLGLDSAEINSGGFVSAPHLPIADIRATMSVGPTAQPTRSPVAAKPLLMPSTKMV